MTVDIVDIKEILVCPICQSDIRWQEAQIRCTQCGAVYPLVDGIPLMLAGSSEKEREASERFDAVAASYNSVFPPHVTNHYLNKRVSLIAGHIKGDTILDVGCGTGRLAERLFQSAYQVVGTDASLGMLRVFRARSGAIPVGAQADLLPFRADSFDGVISIALLHHLADAEKVKRSILEMYRVTRSKGVLILWDHNPGNPYWPIVMKRVPQDFGQERLIPLSEILQDVRQAGTHSITAHKMGFIPDFIPYSLMPLMKGVETLVENTPILKHLAAHNVVVVHKS